MTDPIDDPYEVLGLGRDATPEEVRRRYKDLAVQHHPDRNSEPASVEQFKRIAAAYAILNDPAARRKWELSRGRTVYKEGPSGDEGLREHRVQSATRRSPDSSERRRQETFAREFAEAMARGPESYIFKKGRGTWISGLGWLAVLAVVGAVIALWITLSGGR